MSEQLFHEKLDVYQVSICFLATVSEILEKMPPGNSVLRDHLDRASVSISLNIAEGAGKPTKADAARFYGIARGSGMECAAALDALQIRKAVVDRLYTEGKSLLIRIVSMLTKMCR
jgi:four helix bundle protein